MIFGKIFGKVKNIVKRARSAIKNAITHASPTTSTKPSTKTSPTTSTKTSQRNARINALTQEQMKSAMKGTSDTGLGLFSKNRTQLFYASTRALWAGKDPSKRNEIIMQELGVNNMQEAMNLVFAQNTEAEKYLERKEAIAASISDTMILRELTEEEYKEMIALIKQARRQYRYR